MVPESSSKILLTLWEILNLKVQTVLDIPERLYSEYHISPGFLETVMQKYGIHSTGKEKLEKEFGVGPMSLFVSNTRHYSWPKAGGWYFSSVLTMRELTPVSSIQRSRVSDPILLLG